MSSLEKYFHTFRTNIIGINDKITTWLGDKDLIYADWTASGRLYEPIERRICEKFGKYVANTHSVTSYTGATMTIAFEKAQSIIKSHVNANDHDCLVMVGSGMTSAVAKFQRILGLKVPCKIKPYLTFDPNEKPLVIVTHMEHHSNQTSWLETMADVQIISPDENGHPDLNYLVSILDKYKDRKIKIASITSCSNVTGIRTDYHKIAKIMHKHGGYCFVDFACSAPYVDINMHPADEDECLDAIFFSPHKFLGGPGSPGALIFNDKLYQNITPDEPGGGTVDWTNPWGHHRFYEQIELRESGGTPNFLGTIKAALAIQLKEEMGPDKIKSREDELTHYFFDRMSEISNLRILESKNRDRQSIFSFVIEDCHYNLVVRLLNDYYGIQSRGGCSCAGTYGHYLMNIDQDFSKAVTDSMDSGNYSLKPGWVRVSLHPTNTDQEIEIICNAISEIAAKHKSLSNGYNYDSNENLYNNINDNGSIHRLVDELFA